MIYINMVYDCSHKFKIILYNSLSGRRAGINLWQRLIYGDMPTAEVILNSLKDAAGKELGQSLFCYFF